MKQPLPSPFTVRIDTSGCTSSCAAFDSRLNDQWFYRDLTFQSGSICAIVSEYGQGSRFLTQMLGGRVAFGDVTISCGGITLTQADLHEISWNLEPNAEPFGRLRVRKAIEAAGADFPETAERFGLTPERYDRRFIYLSGERWSASAAYGHVLGKRIFFAPYQPGIFYYQMLQSGLMTALRALTDSGALVVLPCCSDRVLGQFADEVICVDPDYSKAADQQSLSKGD